MDEAPTFDEYRTGYISARWDVPDNAAKALQLFELGFSVSGASKHLPVTESTVSGYHSLLMERIHENITFPLAGKGRHGQFDVWGERSSAEHFRTCGYAEGKAHGERVRSKRTTSQEQLDPEFREAEHPRNKGTPLKEIPKDLISVVTE